MLNASHNLGTERSRRRRVLALAALWLVSWMLLALQPCCEAVAASLPHAHPSPQVDGLTAPGHEHTPSHHPSRRDLFLQTARLRI